MACWQKKACEIRQTTSCHWAGPVLPLLADVLAELVGVNCWRKTLRCVDLWRSCPGLLMGGSMVSAHNTNRLHIWHNGRINFLSSKIKRWSRKQRVVPWLNSAKFHHKRPPIIKVYSWRKIWKPLRKLRKFLQPSKNSPHSCLFCIHGNRETYIWLIIAHAISSKDDYYICTML
jgi:hypothetical protein